VLQHTAAAGVASINLRAAGRIDAEALLAWLMRHPMTDDQPIFAVDLRGWPLCDTGTSPARGLYYHPSPHSARQPIIAA
jgi:hypothetical protein